MNNQGIEDAGLFIDHMAYIRKIGNALPREYSLVVTKYDDDVVIIYLTKNKQSVPDSHKGTGTIN
jgi:hypothetical protein